MDWFLIAIAVVVLVHVLLAVLLWRGVRRAGTPGRSVAFGVLLRFVLVPLILVIVLVMAVLWLPAEPEETVGWILVTALVAYLVYLSLSAVAFGVRLMRER